MEAALRTAYFVLEGKEHEAIKFEAVRGFEGIKEASLTLGGMTVNIAVASGMKNAKVLLDDIRAGKSKYHFIEVMCCPGGCINGGGQPYVPAEIKNFVDYRSLRAKALYDEDSAKELRKSHHNPIVQQVYQEYLGEWGGERAHHILHTTYQAQPKYRL
jgi:NADP-reducing hydrogenase subunit HndD